MPLPTFNAWPTKAQDMQLAFGLLAQAAKENNGQLELTADYHLTPAGEEEIMLPAWVFIIVHAIKATHPLEDNDFIINNVLDEILNALVQQGLSKAQVRRFKELALRVFIVPSDVLH